MSFITPNRIIVSNSLGFRYHAKHHGKLFAMTVKGKDHETVFTVLSLKGSKGRPCKGNTKGFGVKTHAVIRNGFNGRKSTVLLSTLVDRSVRYVGMKNEVIGHFTR
jgi:hypothetical protein